MAWRIVRQPNGLLALFDEVSDSFSVLDMTHAEAVAECRRKGCQPWEADAKVRRGEADEPVPGFVTRTADDGLDRWRDCLETIRTIHGEDAVQTVLRLLEPA